MLTHRTHARTELLIWNRNGETFAFFYTKETLGECLRIMGRWAANPEIAFTWEDAAVLSQAARNRTKGRE